MAELEASFSGVRTHRSLILYCCCVPARRGLKKKHIFLLGRVHTEEVTENDGK